MLIFSYLDSHTSLQKQQSSVEEPKEKAHLSRQNSVHSNAPVEIVEPEPLQSPTKEVETVVAEIHENDHQEQTEVKQEVIENHETPASQENPVKKVEKVKVVRSLLCS